MVSIDDLSDGPDHEYTIFAKPRNYKEGTVTKYIKVSFFAKDGTFFPKIVKQPLIVEEGLRYVYSGAVAPKLESHLLVSTWRNGRGVKVPLHLNNSLIVANIERLTFNLGPKKSEVVENTKDHSKWAISVSPFKRYVCVGSLNRKEQFGLQSLKKNFVTMKAHHAVKFDNRTTNRMN
ncbi:hypothetical protein HPB48_015758 [Haemaphysalis longicornis]|uniref:Uncharacterized protein n=1 Tax=Haemaphysalis longicornis TaxID=44386 RepID=A0A9J6FS50_HAELO|nr:hypothetical protein HPB48_015758 [Haemaphysalis longicornis]